MDFNKGKVLPVILSNLQKAAEKQQDYKAAEHFGELAAETDKEAPAGSDFNELKKLTENQLSELYPSLQKAAEQAGDMGALRALKWGRNVTAIQKSLIDRWNTRGPDLLEGNGLFICEACGFIFVGPEAPRCPVCKAPALRFSKV